MTVHDHLANLLNHIVNNNKVGKNVCNFSPVNKLISEVLTIMKNKNYIKTFEIESNSIGNNVTLEIDKLNYCRAIKPRFNVKLDGYNKFVRRLLPSRTLGILIVSNPKGLLTHKEAIDKNLGGKLIAYCY